MDIPGEIAFRTEIAAVPGVNIIGAVNNAAGREAEGGVALMLALAARSQVENVLQSWLGGERQLDRDSCITILQAVSLTLPEANDFGAERSQISLKDFLDIFFPRQEPLDMATPSAAENGEVVTSLDDSLQDKASGERLGIVLKKEEWDDHRPFRVKDIKDGLVQKWNLKHPDKAVRLGDWIVEVNGLRDVEQITMECQRDQDGTANGGGWATSAPQGEDEALVDESLQAEESHEVEEVHRHGAHVTLYITLKDQPAVTADTADIAYHGHIREDPDAEEGTCYCKAIYGERGWKEFGYLKVLRCPYTKEKMLKEQEKAAAMGIVVVGEDASPEERKKAEQEAEQKYEENQRRAPWGCLWFKVWMGNGTYATEKKQKLQVVYFAGQRGEGKVEWEQLPTADLWDGHGLGGSQKAEVAYLDKMRQKDPAWDYEEIDVARFLQSEFQLGKDVDAFDHERCQWRRGWLVQVPDMSENDELTWMVQCHEEQQRFKSAHVRHTTDPIHKLVTSVAEQRFLQGILKQALPGNVRVVLVSETRLLNGDAALAVDVHVPHVKAIHVLRDQVLAGDSEAWLNWSLSNVHGGQFQVQVDKTEFFKHYEKSLLTLSELTSHQKAKLAQLHRLESKEVHLSAPAGAGKTFVAVQFALDKVYEDESQEPILYVAPRPCLGLHFVQWLIARHESLEAQGGLEMKIEDLLARIVLMHRPYEEYVKLVLQGNCLIENRLDAAPDFALAIFDEAHELFTSDRMSMIYKDVRAGQKLLLSDISQSAALHPSFPKTQHTMSLQEVVRSTKRIVAAALAFEVEHDEGVTTSCCGTNGPPLKTFMFEAADRSEDGRLLAQYSRSTIRAMCHVLRTYPCLRSWHRRIAIIVPHEEFREKFKPMLQEELHSTFTAHSRLQLKSFEESLRYLQSNNGRPTEDEVLVLDTIEEARGQEMMIVICVGLDEEIHARADTLLTRARIYQGITRAQLMAIVVDKLVEGGWLQFLATLKFNNQEFKQKLAFGEDQEDEQFETSVWDTDSNEISDVQHASRLCFSVVDVARRTERAMFHSVLSSILVLLGHGIWENSQDSYEGQWKADLQHGHGRQMWNDGRVYEGRNGGSPLAPLGKEGKAAFEASSPPVVNSAVEAKASRRGCCSKGPRGAVADSDELFQLIKDIDWSQKKPVLTREVTIGQDRWERGSILMSVGDPGGPQEIRLRGGRNREIMKKALQECLDADRPVWVGLKRFRVGMPWCVVLRCPCLVISVTLVGVLSLIGISVTSASIFLNTNFDSFMDSDSAASLNFKSILQAILDAREERAGRRLSSGGPTVMASGLVLEDGTPAVRRLQSGLRLYKTYTFQLTYARRNGGNMMSEGDFAFIRSVEAAVKSLPDFRLLCDTSEPKFLNHCNPGISMANFVFPFQVPDGADARLYLNGSGTSAVPLAVAVALAREEGLTDVVWPEEVGSEVQIVGVRACGDVISNCATWKDQCLQGAEHQAYMQDFCKATCGICDKAVPEAEVSAAVAEEVNAMRSYFTLQAFCCTSGQSGQGARVQEMDSTWNRFVADLVTLVNEKNQLGQVRVFYQGNGIDTFESLAAVASDIKFAIMSYSFVLIYATLHTRSPFLAMVGLFLVMLSIPAALAIFILTSGSGEISLMMCLSVFIVVGVGSDMLFVYTDFYKQSLKFSREPVDRLKFTYLQAASSTAATTFTTAMSFFANLASVLRPLREFGFFMGICVTLAWLIVFLAYPSTLVLGERLHTCCRRCILAQAKPAPRRVSVARSAQRKSMVMLAEALDPEKKGVGAAQGSCLGDYMATFIERFKYPLVLIFLIITAIQGYLAVSNMTQATGIPQTFPDWHNQEAGKEYNGLFGSFEWRKITVDTYPSYALKCANLFRSCQFHRCETHGQRLGNLSSCKCVPHLSAEPSANDGCGHYRVKSRVVGRDGLETGHFLLEDLEASLRSRFPNRELQFIGSSIKSSVLETYHWDSGEEDLRVMLQVPDARLLGNGSGTCVLQEICYCGVQPCEGSSAGVSSNHLRLDGASSAVARRLATTTTPEPLLPPEVRADVLVVFGLVVTGSNRLIGVSTEQPYGFSTDFRPEDPWAQRQSLSLCTNHPEELKIISMHCWLVGFRDWWVNMRNEEWPVRLSKNFHGEAWWYANNMRTGNLETSSFLWFEDEKLIAMYFQCFLNVNRLAGSSVGLEAMQNWDRFMAAFNSQADASIKGAWHASKLWSVSEAEKVILDSTLITLCISLGCVFLGVLVFTRSTHLAIIVMTIVLTIVVGLLFFMVIIMGWAIGAIEVLSLIVFVGFAVDYCLHLSHKYHSCHITDVEEKEEEEVEEEEVQDHETMAQRFGRKSIMAAAVGKTGRRVSMKVSDAPAAKATCEKNKKVLSKNRSAERFERSRYALERIGGSIVGSALTTIGCACFLLPCTMHIFFKLGAVVCGVTIYAVIFSLIPLPAVLMCFGPCGHDFRSILELLGRAANTIMPEDEEEEEEEEPMQAVAPEVQERRYVLNMPSKGMGQFGDTSQFQPTRSRIEIHG
ncbi:unnamed protein product [Durusdinium trenchii]|uniref:Uncharacterized protein n=2 Tax=Durusdinium trenchii TaxID=1381693 RepID=A0ABP0I3Z1_9DINO